MEIETYTKSLPIGRKIERVRRLRGMTQAELGERLGVTKQAISKMEQTGKVDGEKLKQIANALRITENGLRRCTPETILHLTNASSKHPHRFSMERAISLFEELLKMEKEDFKKEEERSSK